MDHTPLLHRWRTTKLSEGGRGRFVFGKGIQEDAHRNPFSSYARFISEMPLQDKWWAEVGNRSQHALQGWTHRNIMRIYTTMPTGWPLRSCFILHVARSFDKNSFSIWCTELPPLRWKMSLSILQYSKIHHSYANYTIDHTPLLIGGGLYTTLSEGGRGRFMFMCGKGI